MAVTSLQVTYDELRENIGMMISGNRTPASWSVTMAADVLRVLRAALRKFYFSAKRNPNDPHEMTHKWSFLQPWKTLTTNEPYSTGTLTVVDGVVTLAGGTFPSWAAGAFVAYANKYYEVATRDGNTQLTLLDTSTDNDAAALTTFTLYQYRFTLPSDFESLASQIYYSPDQSTDNCPLERHSDHHLRKLYQDSSTDTWSSEPKFFALYPADVATTAAQQWYLIIWPFPRLMFHLKYRYNVQMDDLDATNDTPPGGAAHSETILAACLSECELKLNDMPGPHTEEYFRLLAASIQRDRETSTPDTLGCVPIRDPDYSRRDHAVTPTDYVIYPGYTQADFEG